MTDSELEAMMTGEDKAPASFVEPEEVTKEPRLESDRMAVEQPVRQRFHFGKAQAKLTVFNMDPNYRYYWFNDEGGRIEMAMAAMYQFVRKNEVTLTPGVVSRDSELGDRVSVIVGRDNDGTPLRAFLMKRPMKYFDEDQALSQAEIDRQESAIKKGKTTGQEDEKFYIPKGSPIRMTSKLER